MYGIQRTTGSELGVLGQGLGCWTKRELLSLEDSWESDLGIDWCFLACSLTRDLKAQAEVGRQSKKKKTSIVTSLAD